MGPAPTQNSGGLAEIKPIDAAAVIVCRGHRQIFRWKIPLQHHRRAIAAPMPPESPPHPASNWPPSPARESKLRPLRDPAGQLPVTRSTGPRAPRTRHQPTPALQPASAEKHSAASCCCAVQTTPTNVGLDIFAESHGSSPLTPSDDAQNRRPPSHRQPHRALPFAV